VTVPASSCIHTSMHGSRASCVSAWHVCEVCTRALPRLIQHVWCLHHGSCVHMVRLQFLAYGMRLHLLHPSSPPACMHPLPSAGPCLLLATWRACSLYSGERRTRGWAWEGRGAPSQGLVQLPATSAACPTRANWWCCTLLLQCSHHSSRLPPLSDSPCCNIGSAVAGSMWGHVRRNVSLSVLPVGDVCALTRVR